MNSSSNIEIEKEEPSAVSPSMKLRIPERYDSEIKEVAAAVDHVWAHMFFVCHLVKLGDQGKHIGSKEQLKLLQVVGGPTTFTRLQMEGIGSFQDYCYHDSMKLHDFLIRLNTFAKCVFPCSHGEEGEGQVVLTSAEEYFFRNHHWFATTRNALFTMIHYAVNSHLKYRESPAFDEQTYQHDPVVRERQQSLLSLFGGKKPWERICKLQSLWWPEDKLCPKLLSADKLSDNSWWDESS